MADRVHASKKANIDWLMSWEPATNSFSANVIQCILLQEIREELKTLNRLLGCSRFTAIPTRLQEISQQTAVIQHNTTKRKYTRRKP